MRPLDLARFPNAALIALAALPFAIGPSRLQAEPPAGPPNVVHLTVWQLPRPEDTSIGAKSQRAILRAFREKYPYIRLSSPTGITIPEASAMDTRPLMAIAGGVSPDVIYVNFRQSDTYIQEGFLYPLDRWVEKLPAEELSERLPRQVRQVVRRWGPGKRTGEDPDKHYWMLPYGLYIKGICWRKDLFKAAGLDPERPPGNWDEYYRFAQRCTDPDKGTYGAMMGMGRNWSWWFYSFLTSAGASIMADPAGDDNWVATFNTPEAVDAYEFVLKLVQGKWRHSSGKIVEGVVCRLDDAQLTILWNQGRIAMREIYLREEQLADINPELIGIAPVPVGPRGRRASELNCTMCGIFSGAARKGPEVLDAAWKYVHFLGSPEARAIGTRVLVANGYGMFANPKYLARLGYTDYLRRIPKSWRETFDEALRNGEPEPYGRNTQNVYAYVTNPADELLLARVGHKVFDAVEAARARLQRDRPGISEDELNAELEEVRQRTRGQARSEIQQALNKWVDRANVKMIGRVPAEEMTKRRTVGWLVATAIAVAFAGLFAYIVKVFKPAGAKGGWMIRRYWLAYLILIPAVATILLWQYVPMGRGAVMAFQDYHIVKPSSWIGIDNFANVLWDGEFWRSLTNSLWYAFLAIVMGFFAPIVLAILLNEVPKGKILLRTVYYLPAVVSGLVVMLMWKNFYEPSDRGLLNQIITGIPPWAVYLAGAVVTAGLALSAAVNARGGRQRAGGALAALAVLSLGVVLPVWKVVDLPGYWEYLVRLTSLPREGDWAWLTSLLRGSFHFIGTLIAGGLCVAAGLCFRGGRRAVGWGLGAAAAAVAVTVLGSAQFVELPMSSKKWLQDPNWAMFCVILPTVWAGMGPACLIYLAALKTIPEDMYEAADLDGAGFFGKVWHVAIPSIKVLIVINFIGAVVNAFRVAGYILAMTGGGPAGATEVLALKIFFDAFVYLRFGFATATAWILGVMLIGFTIFQLRRLSRVEFRTAT